MDIVTWKFSHCEPWDKTPRRMLGWNIVAWGDELDDYEEITVPGRDRAVRKWIREHLVKGTYRISYNFPECLIERDEDVFLMILRWK